MGRTSRPLNERGAVVLHMADPLAILRRGLNAPDAPDRSVGTAAAGGLDRDYR
jgi:hypothetical protein